MYVACAESGCNSRFDSAMGHERCVQHSLCLNQWAYNPYRCGHCVSFINKFLVGDVTLDMVSSARYELDAHVKKLRRFANRKGESLLVPLYIVKLKTKSTTLDHYRSLEVLQVGLQSPSNDEVVSEQGSSSSQLSSASSRRTEMMEWQEKAAKYE